MLILRPICMYLRSFRKFIYSPEIHRFPFFLDADCFNVEKFELFQTEPQGMDPGFGGRQL